MPSAVEPTSMPITDEEEAIIESFRRLNDRMRLRMARTLCESTELVPPPVLKAMLADEGVPWVRAALEQALALHEQGPARVHSDELNHDDELYAQALHTATREILHEISPLVGRAHLAARKSLGEALTHTPLERELLALKRTVQALRRLSAATAVPVLADFDLSRCLSDLASAESAASEKVGVRASGPSAFIVFADQALIELAVTNLVRNAVEATDALLPVEASNTEVIVNWGTRGGNHWVSVLDRGEGLPAEAAELFARGVTLRAKGSGLGLTTASRAAQGIGGSVELVTNNEGGTTAVLRWPEGSEAIAE